MAFDTAKQPEVLFETKDGLGVITLNRPEALNALNLNMIHEIDAKLIVWDKNPHIEAIIIRGAGDKAFCAGGDVKAVYFDGLAKKQGESEGRLCREFFYHEYKLNRRIKTLSKPYISILNGISMGGGFGLSAHGSHRVVTDKVLFAMPETGIGLFPDVGGGYFLSRCQGHLGLYVAMTGARLKDADCLYLGYGTHYVPSESVDSLIESLRQANWRSGHDSMEVADSVISRFFGKPANPSDLQEYRADIDQHFCHDSVERIFASLAADKTEWAQYTLSVLQKMSPTSLKIAFEQIKRAKNMEFDDVMTMEYRLAQACMAGHDFYEGIRALLVDKDKNPQWNPANLEDVTAEKVQDCFKPIAVQTNGAEPFGDLLFEKR